MHELAHVQRFDCLTQIVGQLARALHWSNPLAWLAVRGLRREQEQACDDRVLHSGLPPTDYAAHLLAVASQKHRLFAPAIGLAMARNSRIERRLASILDARSNRRSLSRAQASLVAAGLLALVIPLASLTTQIKESHAAEQAATKDDVKNDEKQIDAASSDRLARLRQVIVEQYVTPPNEDQVLLRRHSRDGRVAGRSLFRVPSRGKAHRLRISSRGQADRHRRTTRNAQRSAYGRHAARGLARTEVRRQSR